MKLKSEEIKIAILDLYNNEENQGIRCIKDIINEIDCLYPSLSVNYELFDTRYKNEIPNLDYNIFISSGGPGSPFEGENTPWEKNYFSLLDSIWNFNEGNEEKKHLFFICHSFQLMARFFEFGEVVRRNSKSFGVMPVHKTELAKDEIILKNLPEPFYAADFREWQVVQPNQSKIDELNAKILCIEKFRPHVELERAIMAVRISDEIVGTQFHPEADPASMYFHFRKPDRKEHVISKYGEQKYYDMLALLEEENAIKLTRKTVIPNFIKNAIIKLKPEVKSH